MMCSVDDEHSGMTLLMCLIVFDFHGYEMNGRHRNCHQPDRWEGENNIAKMLLDEGHIEILGRAGNNWTVFDMMASFSTMYKLHSMINILICLNILLQIEIDLNFNLYFVLQGLGWGKS